MSRIFKKYTFKWSILSFLFGVFMMPIWVIINEIGGFDTDLIAPEPLWAKMIIGGFIGLVTIPLFFHTLPAKTEEMKNANGSK